jgi:hypothetical protein
LYEKEALFATVDHGSCPAGGSGMCDSVAGHNAVFHRHARQVAGLVSSPFRRHGSFLPLPISRRTGGEIDTINIFLFGNILLSAGNTQSNLFGPGNQPTSFLLTKVDFGENAKE